MRFIRKSWNRLKPFVFSQSWLSREDLNAVTADLVHLNKNKAGVKAFLHQSPHLLLHHRCILRPYYITNIYLLSLISDLMGPPKMASTGLDIFPVPAKFVDLPILKSQKKLCWGRLRLPITTLSPVVGT